LVDIWHPRHLDARDAVQEYLQKKLRDSRQKPLVLAKMTSSLFLWWLNQAGIVEQIQEDLNAFFVMEEP